MSFQSLVRKLAPGYMADGRHMGTLLEASGLMLDALAERSFLGRCAAIPYAAGAKTADGLPLQCEPEVLPWHARDRGITLYPSEPLGSRRYRCSRWRQLHAMRGTHRGELKYAQPYFLGEDGLGTLPRMRIVHQDGDGDGAMWHTLSGSADPGGAGRYSIYRKVPSNWDFDGLAEKWSRWWAIVYTSGTVLESGVTYWNDGHPWNGGQVWGGVALQVVTDLVTMFLEWHSAHSRCAGIILASDLGSFDPTATSTVETGGSTTLPVGNWGQLVDPATNLPTRLSTATWIYDRYYQ